MVWLPDFDAFVVRQGRLKLLPQVVQETVHVVARLEVGRRHDFRRA